MLRMCSPVTLHCHNNERAAVVHGHFHLRPRMSLVGTKCADKVGFLAIPLHDGTTHGKAPYHRLTWGAKEDGVRIRKLNRTLPA
jgi:hypothetical protein